MTTQEDVDEFLAHHGVKGMRWGVRTKNAVEGGVPSNRSLSDRQKTALKVAGGAAMITGAATVAYLIKRNGGTKTSSIRDVKRALSSSSGTGGTHGLLSAANNLSKLTPRPETASGKPNLSEAYSIVNRYGKSSYNSIAAKEMAKHDWGRNR